MDPIPLPNAGAAGLLRSADFQRLADQGVECSMTTSCLAEAAGDVGGSLMITPSQGARRVHHLTKHGLADSEHHEVFTDGYWVFDPVLGEEPVLRSIFESQIRELNGPDVNIMFASAR